MKQRLFIIIGLIVVTVVLVGLNAASYSQKEKPADNEFMANRSTYNNGTTGTRAFYDLLAETGRRVVRWQDPPADLSAKNGTGPSVFVMAGPLPRDVTSEEATDILRWVSGGGRLVLIDREPPKDLITTTANWSVVFSTDAPKPFIDVDSSNQKMMTADTPAARPTQPSVFTNRVNAVQPSQYAQSVSFSRCENVDDFSGMAPKTVYGVPVEDSDAPPPPAASPTPLATVPVETTALAAPVIHFSNGARNVVVDAPYGQGRIVFVSDPFIVANGGITMADNAQLGINLVAVRDGIIAFDEFHHGYGSDNNRLLEYFSGTPVITIFFQVGLIIVLVMYSRSRRFARALPESEPDRLSKLEYVSAMAQLQHRTKAYDLAIENIYGDFRRRTARLLGIDAYATPRGEFAALIAKRSKASRAEIEDLMIKCENVSYGSRSSRRETLDLVRRIRELESELGLRRR